MEKTTRNEGKTTTKKCTHVGGVHHPKHTQIKSDLNAFPLPYTHYASTIYSHTHTHSHKHWKEQSSRDENSNRGRTASPRRSPQHPQRRSGCIATPVFARWHCACAGSHTPHGRMIQHAHQMLPSSTHRKPSPVTQSFFLTQ